MKVKRKKKSLVLKRYLSRRWLLAGTTFALYLAIFYVARVQLLALLPVTADSPANTSLKTSATGSTAAKSQPTATSTSDKTAPTTTPSGTPSPLIKELDTSTPAQTTTPPPTAPSPPQDTYQVNEQFSGASLDSSLWEAFTAPKGYRNNEEQDYSPSQIKVSNGTLQITAQRDNQGAWHSGEVYSKWNYTYGEFEVRMALSATGQGVWPAAWMMGTADDWPSNGEIDMIENINGTSTVYGTIHGGNSIPWQQWSLGAQFSPIDITQYHTYKIIKSPGVISWWIDGAKRAEWHQSDMPSGPNGNVWPFENHRNFGLLNLAIGGNWPGPSDASTPNNIVMYVDYFTVKNAS